MPDKPNLVKAIKGNTTITLTINQNTAYINGQQVTLDQASELKNNRTMVPDYDLKNVYLTGSN